MQPAAIELIRDLQARFAAQEDRLVIDADTHATDLAALAGAPRARYESSPGYYHGRPVTAAELVAEMDMSEVDLALVWQNPAATAYTGDHDRNAEALLAANRYVFESALRHRGRFVPGGWVDPKACGAANALRMVDTLAGEFGFFVIKMNPAQNGYPIDSQEVSAVAGRIVERGAVPAFHFGADTPYTPAEGLRRIAARCGECPVLAIHMGGGGAGYVEAEELYHDARRLGLEMPNLRYALSARRDAHMESDFIAYESAGEPFRRHLFCASDAPYGRMSWNFGGFRQMFRTLMDGRHPDSRLRRGGGLFQPESVRNYLGGNFARFAAAGYARLLAAQGISTAVCR